MNPLDWNGQQFLAMYGPFLLFVLVGALIWKRLLNRPAGAPTVAELDMNPYLMATLESDEAAVNAAVVALVHDGTLSFEGGQLSVAKALPTRALELERVVHDAVAAGRTSLEGLRVAARTELSRIEQSLRARGFMRTAEQDSHYRLHPRLLFLAALALGVMKVMVGLSRGRPVSHLVLLILLGGAVGLLLLSGRARLTPRGKEALRLLRGRHASLRTSASSEGSDKTMSARDVALAAGLFGVGGSPCSTATPCAPT
ncbi:TIGR04222 domain-containing membrane protein [Cystobacter fuscus]